MRRFGKIVAIIVVALLVCVINTYAEHSDVFGVKPMEKDDQIYEFLLNDQVVLRYRSMYQGLSAQERAEIILERAQKFGQAIREGTLAVEKINESFVVTVDGKLFVTVTEADFQANNSTGEGLANVWMRNILAARVKEAPSTDKEEEPISPGKQPAEQSKLSGEVEKTGSGKNSSTGQNKQTEQKEEQKEEQQGGPEEPTEGLPEEGTEGTPPVNHHEEMPPVNNGEEAEPENKPADVEAVDSSTQEAAMLKLVNQERAKAGVAPLTMEADLVQIARLKSQDMITNNYFAHNSPTYGDPFTMMTNMGIKYGYAGENLAGNPSLDNAHETLMDSPGHRKNILNPNYTHVGIGIVEGGPYGKMYTQLFISKL